MAKTRVLKRGNWRFLRIPRDIRLPIGEVEIFKRGGEVVIRAPRDTLADIPDLLAGMPEDFLAEGISDRPPQRRRIPHDVLAGTRSPFEVGKDVFGRYASGRRDLSTQRRALYAQVTVEKRRARG